ncbi:MAG: hypothetical protein EOM20_06825 [Spartobacteria bacterium]|nr:hypothetical protein [Spartobacteria bacterium]
MADRNTHICDPRDGAASPRAVSPTLYNQKRVIARTVKVLFAGYLLFTGSGWAAEPGSTGQPPLADMWLAYLVMSVIVLLSLVSAVVTIWDKLRAKPPLYKQFAAVNHEHHEYATISYVDGIRVTCRDERKALLAKDDLLIEQMHELQKDMTQGFRDLNQLAEIRSAKIHNRINPMSQEIRSNSDALSNHLEDHRSGRYDNAG